MIHDATQTPTTKLLPLRLRDVLAARCAEALESFAGKGALALVDQAVVSGSSFVTTVLVGRFCGADELGVYSLGLTLLILIGALQEALILVPYTVYSIRLSGEARAEYAGSVLIHQGLYTLAAMLCLLVGHVVVAIGIGPQRLSAVILVLLAVIPFFTLREFIRRLIFARLDVTVALLLDFSVAAVQLVGLAWLAASGRLTAVSAYLAVATACAAACVVWFGRSRMTFRPTWTRARGEMRRHWSFGRWITASQLTAVLQGYGMHWLLAGMVATSATGVYAACITVVLLFNPVLLGIGNVLAPRAARALHERGPAEVRRVIWKTTLLLGSVQTAFCLMLCLFGAVVMQVLFPGDDYSHSGSVIVMLAAAVLASGLGFAADNGLWVIERPDVNFKLNLLGLAVSISVALAMIPTWGVLGAAAALFAGNLTGSVLRCIAFSRLTMTPACQGECP